MESIIPVYDNKIEDKLIKESEKLQVVKILNLLKDREHDILRMCFGIGVPQMPMTEISKFFGISSERVRQLRDQAIKFLQTTCSNRINKILNG